MTKAELLQAFEGLPDEVELAIEVMPGFPVPLRIVDSGRFVAKRGDERGFLIFEAEIEPYPFRRGEVPA